MHTLTVLLRDGWSAPEMMPLYFRTSLDKIIPARIGNRLTQIINIPMIDPCYDNSLMIINFDTEPITRKIARFHYEGVWVYELLCDQEQFKWDYEPQLTYAPGCIVMFNNCYYRASAKVRGHSPVYAQAYISKPYTKGAHVRVEDRVYRCKRATALPPPSADWTEQPWQYLAQVGTKFPAWWQGDRTCAQFTTNLNKQLEFAGDSSGICYDVTPQLVGLEQVPRSHLPKHMQARYTTDRVAKLSYCTEVHLIRSDVTRGEPSIAIKTLLYLLPDGIIEPTPTTTPIPFENHDGKHSCVLSVLTGDHVPIILQPHELPSYQDALRSITLHNTEPAYAEEYLEANRAMWDAITTPTESSQFLRTRIAQNTIRAQSNDDLTDDPDKVRCEYLAWREANIAERDKLQKYAMTLVKQAKLTADRNMASAYFQADAIENLIKARIHEHIPTEKWLEHHILDIYDSVSWDMRGEVVTATSLMLACHNLKVIWCEAGEARDGMLTPALKWAQYNTAKLQALVSKLPKHATIKRLRVAHN